MEPSTPAAAAGGLRVEDGVVVGVYFLFVFAVGVWSSIRSKKRNLSGYFLASRSMHWIPIGASLFASNIGSGHFIGLAGTGAASGIAVAGFELSAMFWLVVLGWVFVPVYLAAGVYTMPEYLRLRLGGQRIRVYLSVLAILLYVFTKISVDLYAGALFIQRAMRWEGEWGLYTSIILLLVVAAAFTIFGGLTAVVWTDLAQTALMVAGACVLTALSFSAVGGYGAMIQQYFESLPSANVSAFDSDNRSCSTVRNDSMHLFRDPVNSDLPWPGMIFGMSIISLWYWCSDQVIVQRALAARSLAHAKAGTVLAALLKVLPLWLMVFPGMAARVLYKDRVACSDPDACWRLCRSRSGCSNLAYIELVVQLLPPGLSGMMLAVMLAALMSSLTSIFNSASTLFSIDIYKRIRTNATEVEQVIVGRVFVVVMVGISIVWVPIINNFSSDQLFVYIQSMQSYLPPPICAVYVLSVFWSRTTEPGAFCGLVLGLAVGVARFAMEFSFLKPACGSAAPDLRPGWVRRLVFDIHYLHFGPLLFALVCVVVVVVSLMTEPLPAECLHRLTFWTRHSRAERRPLPSDGATDPAGGDGGAAKRQGDEPEGDEAPSGCRRALGMLCCISGAEADAESAAQSAADGRQTEQTEELKAHADSAILHETRWQKIALNIAAVLVMTLSAVLYIYYR